MNIELTSQQVQVLKQLVDARIGELHPEIRRSRTYTYHDELKHDLQTLEDLRSRLESAGGAPQQPQA